MTVVPTGEEAAQREGGTTANREARSARRVLVSVILILLVSLGVGSIVVDVFAVVSIAQPTSAGPAYEDLKTQLLLSIVKTHGLLVTLILFFLFLFRLIFSHNPIAWLYGSPKPIPVVVGPSVTADGVTAHVDPRRTLADYGAETSAIAREIFLRSGVYLYVGVLIASVGVIFFAWRSFGTVSLPHGKDWGEVLAYLIHLLPSAGVLFFIEFIAFFFLRQSRATMDEFRYFDAVRRHREENLVILQMFAEYNETVPTSDVLKAMNMYSSSDRMTKDQTTELLEFRKLQKDEAFLFEKILDIVKEFREKGSSERSKESKAGK